MINLFSRICLGMAALACSCFLFSCTQNALSGKKQLTMLPEAEVQSLASSQYNDFIRTHPVVSPKTNANAAMVNRVGLNISKAVQRFYASRNNASVISGYNWEYNLVNDNAVNAWCMPGGKIVVYSGLLPVTLNENALAVVIGHEVSHALLQHGNRRMSGSMLQQLGGMTLSVALSKKPSVTQDNFMQAYGIGTEVGVMLPFSRKHKLEADRYGLIWAAMAGYDPNEALAIWERMEIDSVGQQVHEFLRTHPSDAIRKEKIKSYLPEAMRYKGK